MHVFTDVHRPPVLLPTLRLTCNSADMHAHVCVSMWTCFRLLCLYVHRPVFEYSEHTSVGRYESHVYVQVTCVIRFPFSACPAGFHVLCSRPQPKGDLEI